jgi:hypothetical protein
VVDIKIVTNGIGLAAAAEDELVATSSVRRMSRVLVPALTLWALVIALEPVLDTRLTEQPAFIPVVVALVCCFNCPARPEEPARSPSKGSRTPFKALIPTRAETASEGGSAG